MTKVMVEPSISLVAEFDLARVGNSIFGVAPHRFLERG
jgi:hypothetical protein